jgi:hypothetical protein
MTFPFQAISMEMGERTLRFGGQRMVIGTSYQAPRDCHKSNSGDYRVMFPFKAISTVTGLLIRVSGGRHFKVAL